MKQKAVATLTTAFMRAPGMGDNLVVKVHYGLGSTEKFRLNLAVNFNAAFYFTQV